MGRITGQVPSRGPPVAACLELLTKPVAMRSNTATRAVCAWCRLCRKTPFSRHSSVFAADDDRRPSIPQLNTEGFTASKISVIEQLAYKKKALVIVLQETHCTTAEKLMIPTTSH